MSDPLAPSFTLLKVRNIRIGAHWSWLIVFALWAWQLASELFPSSYPGLSGRSYLVMGLVSAVIFFASILLHELGHSLQALKEGMQIRDITLWLFGGVARFEGMFPSAGAEFRIAIAGPVVSVALAILFWVLAAGMAFLSIPEEAVGICDYLSRINLILVAFNMVPALPLDGGRVLRSWLWQRQDNFTSATISAARAGKGFGYLLIGAGVAQFFTVGLSGGIWFVVLGWFLYQAAEAEQDFALLSRAFRSLPVRDLMTADPVVVPGTRSVAEFLDDKRVRDHSTYPVTEDGKLLGLVSLRLASAVPPARRADTTVADVMLPANQTPVVRPDVPIFDALDPLRTAPGRAVVMDGGRIVGIVSGSDVAKAVEVERTRGLPDRPARSARPVWALVATIFVIAAALIYRPPLVVVSPGPAIDVGRDVNVRGIPATRLNGRYLLLTVHISEPTALGAAYALLNPELDLITRSALLGGEGISEEEFLRGQRRLFEESRKAAAAAAASAAGMEVKLSGAGAQVVDVVESAPAGGRIRLGDVITAIDGRPVMLASDLRSVTTARPAGTTFRLEVQRRSRTITVRVKSARIPSLDQPITGIGVVAVTRDLDVQLPFEVDFRDRNIGGPSAGLAYALAIADIIDARDVARGRSLAASGTIQLTGEVGVVGGLEQKAQAAREANAEVVLVPKEELDQVEGRDVHGVESLGEALQLLNSAA
jgi:PDZ domain-containing secreted protein/Zn-dependent protease/predicted transcriptional regulator